MSAEQKEHIQYLLEKYLEATITATEEETLFSYLESRPQSEVEELVEELMLAEPELANYNALEWQPVVDRVLSHRAKIVHMQGPKPWYRFAIAAAIIGVMAVAGWLIWNKQSPAPWSTATKQNTKDISPGAQGAILTLSDGRQVILDSTKGNIANEGGVAINNKNGSVSYSPVSTHASLLAVYNTISTPRGRQYQLTLQDGTEVWLNAQSSIRFPTSFTGKERVVEITGEAYFEVAHDASHPFIVTKGETSVTVLGTHFNVNAYDDEGGLKVTLLQGSVRVSANRQQQTAIIKPGEQAKLTPNSQWLIVNPDLDAVTAWKNGTFKFNETDIQSVMRQAERWYDVTIQYPNGVPSDVFSGTISRNVGLKDFLKILEYSDIDVKIDGRIVIIKK
jgi:transmembrane sensor